MSSAKLGFRGKASQLLSPLKELISRQPSPFVNLKSLKVYPEVYYAKERQTIPAEVKKRGEHWRMPIQH
nr:hypothetical protein [Tanacetum cinerariifolium]